jgi:transposase
MHKASGRSWSIHLSHSISCSISESTSPKPNSTALCCLILQALSANSTPWPTANPAFTICSHGAVSKGLCLPGFTRSWKGTGVYHEQATLALADAGVTVSIVNPAQVKNFGKGLAVRTKTDCIDSMALARYGALLKPATWTPPSLPARTLQALLARREAIAQDLHREQNRQKKADATDTPELICQSLNDSIAFLQKQLDKLQQDINDHIDRHPDLKEDLDLLTSIPAVEPQVGSHMLSVMHAHSFESAEQLAAYLGLVPIERQSGTSVHGRARLSKAGPTRVCAVLSTRHNPHIKALYVRLLAKGKAKMAALGAVMRKLMHLCFGVLKTRKPYQADYAKIA